MPWKREPVSKKVEVRKIDPQKSETKRFSRAELREILNKQKDPRDLKSNSVSIEFQKETIELSKISKPLNRIGLFKLKRRLANLLRQLDGFYAEEIKLGISTNEESKKRVSELIDVERKLNSKLMTLENAGILPNGFLHEINKKAKK